ncbi:hypothetical protein QA601_18345 [Chitinispirillales bacterium ANBcel5]|uniref:hypothetical protein n=1 Tax=Cellulosispirillum alkaliphilum TaxID=3039283 RepID=UPI002A576380|nr:hypothetical protein [Chitinispirillales bacterium ANBcel5]
MPPIKAPNASARRRNSKPKRPGVSSIIKQKADAIPDSQVVKQHMPPTIFVKEVGKWLTYMEADREAWVKTGFPWSQFLEFSQLHSELFKSISDVVVNRNNISNAMKMWKEKKKEVLTERGRMLAATKAVTQTDKIYAKVIKEITSGYSNMDCVQDILSLTELLMTATENKSPVTIGDVTIDKTYLSAKNRWANEMKRTLNKAEASRYKKHKDIVYRNKIIMLCRQAKDEIALWFDSVYFDNPERKAVFTSDYYSKMNKKNKSPKKENN